MIDEKKPKSWNYSHERFIEFLNSEYGKWDQKLRERINWGCNCHFGREVLTWELLNKMFDYVIGLYFNQKEEANKT